MYYKAVVQADLLYGAAAYHHSLSATDRKKITALTRAGVRTVMLAPPWTPTSPLLLKLKLQPLSVIVSVKQLL